MLYRMATSRSIAVYGKRFYLTSFSERHVRVSIYVRHTAHAQELAYGVPVHGVGLPFGTETSQVFKTRAD